MGTPDDFRKYSHECIELAQKTRAEHHRVLLLDMARTWLMLAGMPDDEIDRIAADNAKKLGVQSSSGGTKSPHDPRSIP